MQSGAMLRSRRWLFLILLLCVYGFIVVIDRTISLYCVLLVLSIVIIVVCFCNLFPFADRVRDAVAQVGCISVCYSALHLSREVALCLGVSFTFWPTCYRGTDGPHRCTERLCSANSPTKTNCWPRAVRRAPRPHRCHRASGCWGEAIT